MGKVIITFIKLFKNNRMQGVRDLRSEAYFFRTLQRRRAQHNAAGGCFSTAYEEVFL